MSTDGRFWTRRLRWRLRGAWRWPVFALAATADALLIHRYPAFGGSIDLIGAAIVSTAGNLMLVLATEALTRRAAQRPAGTEASFARIPPEILVDRIGAAALAAGVLGVAIVGLVVGRPLVVSETEATEENARLVRRFVEARGTAEVKRNLDTANTRRLAEGYFRTCISLDDRTRAYCLFVDTKRDSVRPDRDSRPNAVAIR